MNYYFVTLSPAKLQMSPIKCLPPSLSNWHMREITLTQLLTFLDQYHMTSEQALSAEDFCNELSVSAYCSIKKRFRRIPAPAKNSRKYSSILKQFLEISIS